MRRRFKRKSRIWRWSSRCWLRNYPSWTCRNRPLIRKNRKRNCTSRLTHSCSRNWITLADRISSIRIRFSSSRSRSRSQSNSKWWCRIRRPLITSCNSNLITFNSNLIAFNSNLIAFNSNLITSNNSNRTSSLTPKATRTNRSNRALITPIYKIWLAFRRLLFTNLNLIPW